jgi:hypothetical protein
MLFNVSELPKLDFERPSGSVDINSDYHSIQEDTMEEGVDQRSVTFKGPNDINNTNEKSLYFNPDTLSGMKFYKIGEFEEKECICIEDQDDENR